MAHGTLNYYRADERPPWEPTVRVNGAYDDMTTGFSFVVLLRDGSQPPVVTKVTGITGGPAGLVRVAWSTDELDIAPGAYRAVLTATRDSDLAQWTIEEQLVIRAR